MTRSGERRIDVRRAAAALLEASAARPKVALILGSGLAQLEDALSDPTVLPMEDVPGLFAQTVAGHGGRFVFGQFAGVDVLLQAGRYHAYEGHPLDVVTAPIRILHAAGVESAVMTNAVGAIHPRLEPGDLVLLDDQVNVSFLAPLAGPVVGEDDRFPDMSAPFDGALQGVARMAASALGIALQRGTYAGVLGPSYETRAEVRMLRALGGDVVGMSTVPEMITANAVGLRCVALSLVTNKATGLGDARITHEDVLARGKEASDRFARLILEIVRRIGAGGPSSTSSPPGAGGPSPTASPLGAGSSGAAAPQSTGAQ